jgi:hypothetical protein
MYGSWILRFWCFLSSVLFKQSIGHLEYKAKQRKGWQWVAVVGSAARQSDGGKRNGPTRVALT